MSNPIIYQLDWKRIKYFTRKEWEPNADKVNPNLIFTLDAMREFCGKPVMIHCAFETSGHSENSYHYQGEAVDFHIKGLDLLEQYLVAEMFNPGGLGVYPYWNNSGLHFDLRLPKEWRGSRWWRDKEGRYWNLTSQNYKEAFGLKK